MYEYSHEEGQIKMVTSSCKFSVRCQMSLCQTHDKSSVVGLQNFKITDNGLWICTLFLETSVAFCLF